MSLIMHHCFCIRTSNSNSILYLFNRGKAEEEVNGEFLRIYAPLLPPGGTLGKQQSEIASLNHYASIYLIKSVYLL